MSEIIIITLENKIRTQKQINLNFKIFLIYTF